MDFNSIGNRKYVKRIFHVFLKETYSTPKRYFDPQKVYGQKKVVLAHAVEGYRVSTGFPLLILNLCPRWRWVNFTQRPLYLRYQLNRRQGGRQSRYDRVRDLDHQARSLVTIHRITYLTIQAQKHVTLSVFLVHIFV